MKDDRFYLIRVAEDIERIEKFTAAGRAEASASAKLSNENHLLTTADQ